MAAIPITIITGFLGSGKTTLILNLIPQLPKDYKLALIKNEFGDVAVDSQLAASSAISGVKELLNGCICCNLVGPLGDALETLRTEQSPDRIVIETSGSAFPATLAMEINRISKEKGHYLLDGVITVIDVENWKGYDDTSPTAKLQARYTDLLVLNKWEHVSERAYEDCVDRILDLELDVPTPRQQSNKGWVDKRILLGLDAKLAKSEHSSDHSHEHEHDHNHQSEVEVLVRNSIVKFNCSYVGLFAL
jgi:G3E family GTPase